MCSMDRSQNLLYFYHFYVILFSYLLNNTTVNVQINKYLIISTLFILNTFTLYKSLYILCICLRSELIKICTILRKIKNAIVFSCIVMLSLLIIFYFAQYFDF